MVKLADNEINYVTFGMEVGQSINPFPPPSSTHTSNTTAAMQVGHSQSLVQVGQSIVAYTKVPLQTRDTDWLFVRHHMISAWVCHVEKRKKERKKEKKIIVQELCESRGGRPGLSVLTSLLVSVDVKLY